MTVPVAGRREGRGITMVNGSHPGWGGPVREAVRRAAAQPVPALAVTQGRPGGPGALSRGGRAGARPQRRLAAGRPAGLDRPSVPAAGRVRALGGPARGFGRMWQKTYRMNVGASVPADAVMAAWEQSFPGLWPTWHRCAVSVLHADTESFTVSTGPGDRLAGWITLTAEQAGHGTAVCVHVLLRAHDPLSELGLMLGGYRRYDRCWAATMGVLAERLGVARPVVEARSVCLDARRNWANTRNLSRSPALRGRPRRDMAWAMGVPLGLACLGALALRAARPVTGSAPMAARSRHLR